MQQLWQDSTSEPPMDLMLTNDKGEDYNMSEAVRDMNDKIVIAISKANRTLWKPVVCP